MDDSEGRARIRSRSESKKQMPGAGEREMLESGEWHFLVGKSRAHALESHNQHDTHSRPYLRTSLSPQYKPDLVCFLPFSSPVPPPIFRTLQDLEKKVEALPGDEKLKSSLQVS